jgi:ferric-dicitrate binding protein FerR (iron transport regulator)
MDDRNKQIDTLTVRYLQGICSKEEREQLFSYLQDDPENEAVFFQMKEIFDTRTRIDAPVKMKQPAKKAARVKFRVPQWVRYAAIVAILFGATSIFYLLDRKPISANAAISIRQIVVHNTRGVYQLTLPDSSKVWLHGGTTLTYPEHFTDSIRRVDLQGEAYFTVHADVDHPFIVQTSAAKIRATGTEFNVTAYPEDKVTTTTLVKGIVDIRPNKLNISVELKPNQQALVADNGANMSVQPVGTNDTGKTAKKKDVPVIVQEINTELFTDWKDGIYRFKNEPFQNIALRLEKMYGIDIRIESKDLQKASFSGMFTVDYSLKEVFEIINISNPISYRMEDKVLYIKNKKH